ncbi:hypothetical protein F4553_000549 [Allocatelliglobosispora scoriae]|uniref:Uncharacterized protein n=1 Tax=Allocatelliglobosispora scoriae TaxID=643052 RepID=A0A841BK26_9ACTN|nr:hypothetical protein [Allocatelliglobosispora scoriae]MBB5867170.1 hypothetical protein [Allocatelliglobosispora scoriae]
MSDDRIREGLRAYADQVQRGAAPAPAREVRHRAARRRQRRAAGAAFAAVLLAAIGASTVLGRWRAETPGAPAPASSGAAPSSTPPSRSASPLPSPTVVADVSKLAQISIDLRADVLIDVADDGVDRFLEVGANGVVDFTGTAKGESTMMALYPAPVAGQNLVVIKPRFWNQEAGPGHCVADTAGAALTLAVCVPGDPAQTWRVVPAGDSGQFELAGRYGILQVLDGLITTGDGGRTGLQTLPFS